MYGHTSLFPLPQIAHGDVLKTIEEKNFQFRTFPIVDVAGKLWSCLRVVKERYRDHKVFKVCFPEIRYLPSMNLRLEMIQ